MIVWGRNPPSRWSCSSTLGARRTWSSVGAIGSAAAVMPGSFQKHRRAGVAPMRVFTTLDEVVAATGQDLGTSEWLTIEQDRVDLFAEATGDHQWIHVDVERAKDGPFGGTIAHGYLTLSLVPFLGSQVFSFETPGAKLNYGTNKVRFPHPVLVGKRTRAHVAIADVAALAKGKQPTIRYTIEIEDEAKPACVAETVVLLL